MSLVLQELFVSSRGKKCRLRKVVRILFYCTVYGKYTATDLLSPFSFKCVITQNNGLLHEFDFKYCLSRPGSSATFCKSVKIDIQPPRARGTRVVLCSAICSLGAIHFSSFRINPAHSFKIRSIPASNK
jgi:hypothetical protein